MSERFTRLVRFQADDNITHYGEAILPPGVSDLAKTTQARIIKGDVLGAHRVTDQVVDVKQLVSPLPRNLIPTVRCLGLNYAQHAKEAQMPLPKYPVLFHKPATALTGPSSPIPVPLHAQPIPDTLGVDYECELVVVIGTTGKDIPVSRALEHVLGYAVGNDVSQREWQLKLGGGQWTLGKCCDGWAPWGPGIVSRSAFGDEGNKAIRTRLNGQTVQDSVTKDMVFNVKETVSFLSRGTTLKKGDLIFMGTPQGVGMGREPQVWLKDGDVVEVELESVGTCTNTVAFEKEKSKL